ncbi:MAG: tyrosine-protein kinase, partial [Pseudonocardiales bacterium]|nr:tyrosine-protein kinase [Pseudonocardiales bacterium]
MELRDFIRVVRKRWWLVLAVLGIAVGAGAIVTIRTPPQYASSVTFFVTTSNRGDVADAYQGGLFSQQRVKSYADLLTSERLARAITTSERLGMSPDQVAGRISAVAIPETVLLRATVTDGSRARSEQIAKALATEFVALIRTLETPPGALAPTVKVEVVGGPRLQVTPVSPRPVRNLGLAALIGLICGIGLALLREMLDTTVKSLEVLRELSGAPTLVTVAFDASAKKAPVVIEDTGHSPRAEAFRQLRTNLQFVNVDRPLKA